MTNDLQVSPWYLFLLFELLYTAIHYPTQNLYIRKWILSPSVTGLAWMLWSQSSALPDKVAIYTIGCTFSTQLCALFHLIYVSSNFPNDWRRVKDGDNLPSVLSLGRKMDWMIDLAWGVRMVGWIQEPKGALPPRPKFNSRFAFVASRVGYALFHFLLADLAMTYMARNSAFDMHVHLGTDGAGTYIRARPLLLQFANVAVWGFAAVCSMSMTFYGAAALSVGLGLHEPKGWPPMFGSFAQAYTVRTFWG